ncbi:hypothetical protein EB796_008792 [Bugula neritina]|uniref:Uncharacterized protein n=1 Tax=Bugula neritina TaxID=10212 RepID=A0A7J7K3V9_BUGNE|nr:hypothetical protein EB796_008792 [Bugula neritina]
MPPMTYAAHKYYNKLAKKGNKVPAANKKEEEQQIEEGGVKKESSSTAENDPETGAAIILPTIKDFLCCN